MKQKGKKIENKHCDFESSSSCKQRVSHNVTLLIRKCRLMQLYLISGDICMHDLSQHLLPRQQHFVDWQMNPLNGRGHKNKK